MEKKERGTLLNLKFAECTHVSHSTTAENCIFPNSRACGGSSGGVEKTGTFTLPPQIVFIPCSTLCSPVILLFFYNINTYRFFRFFKLRILPSPKSRSGSATPRRDTAQLVHASDLLSRFTQRRRSRHRPAAVRHLLCPRPRDRLRQKPRRRCRERARSAVVLTGEMPPPSVV